MLNAPLFLTNFLTIEVDIEFSVNHLAYVCLLCVEPPMAFCVYVFLRVCACVSKSASIVFFRVFTYMKCLLIT